jgi:hypothetical protein
MLTPSQIADMKHKDPAAFNLWRLVTEAINEFGLQMGVDPKPANQVDIATAIPPPKAPKSINVVSIAGAVLVLLEAGEGNLPTAFYFVESSTTRTFQQVTRYTLGHGLHLAVPTAAGTTYWRANCKYQMSGQSPYTVFFTPTTTAGGGGSPGVPTPTMPTLEDLRKRPLGSGGGGDVEEPVSIPGRPGRPGVAGAAGVGRPGPPGQAEEPEPPLIIPGRRGASGVGTPGRDSKVPGPAGEEAETPMVIPGPRGRAGRDGVTRFIPLTIDEPEALLNIPGKKGATGAPGAGGSGVSGTAVLDFGAFPGTSDASVAVTGQAGIVSGSIVRAWIRPVATADHSADEHLLETMSVVAGNIVAGTGFTIYGINTNQVNPAKTFPTSQFNKGGGSWPVIEPSVGSPSPRIYGQWNVAWQWS